MEVNEKLIAIPALGGETDHSTVALLSFQSIYTDTLKRVLDLMLFCLFAPLTLPFLLFLIILIRLDSKGPTIYRSTRVGKDGKTFRCLKLRTMHLNADAKLKSILKCNKELRKEYATHKKLKNDPRITRIGKYLRSTSLDELPQIFNVFKGEMSFVGPRPAFQHEINTYPQPYYVSYINVRPGITGIWQINGRSHNTFASRMQMDAMYSHNLSLSLDLKILLKTIPVVLSRKGAY